MDEDKIASVNTEIVCRSGRCVVCTMRVEFENRSELGRPILVCISDIGCSVVGIDRLDDGWTTETVAFPDDVVPRPVLSTLEYIALSGNGRTSNRVRQDSGKG